MKMTTKMILGCLAACCAFDAAAAEVSQVVVRQRWPWSRLVDIDYVLACDPSEKMDVSVAAYNGSETLSLPPSSFSGDLYGVSDGTHRIVWDPMATAYTNSGALTSFRVGLTATNSPVYMIVDLTKNAGADGQIEYIYPGDARLETSGRWTNVWFGVTNDSVYATDKLVLRRVHAGTFGMGDSASTSTTLTKEFYAGVFEVTQRQWELIMGTRPSFYSNTGCYMARPLENRSYDDIRGATNGTVAINWPATGHAVAPDSFLGQLLTKTGLGDFDLPTEAQWECLCRAGTGTVFNDGNASANVSGANANTNAWLDALGRYQFNGGYIDGRTAPSSSTSDTNGTATAGSYLPNAWGIYDTHGNVWEWCLDWWSTGSLSGGTDPEGTAAGSGRVIRGGALFNPAMYCRSSIHFYYESSYRPIGAGFRLVRTLP